MAADRRPLQRRRLRSSVAVLVVAGVAMLGSGPAVGSAAMTPCWPPPVAAPIVDPFRAPPCPYCAGNRGIEYGTAPGALVRSVAAGRVTFVGTVAGTGYVVVQLASGWKVTYGNVTTTLQRDDVVVTGSPIGRATGSLYFGVRIGDRYIDPASYLGQRRFRARLVPTDGSAGNDPGPPVLTCG